MLRQQKELKVGLKILGEIINRRFIAFKVLLKAVELGANESRVAVKGVTLPPLFPLLGIYSPDVTGWASLGASPVEISSGRLGISRA